MKYKHTLNGRTFTRSSQRSYTHVLVEFGRAWDAETDSWYVLQWSGSEKAAAGQINKWIKGGYRNIRVELINGGIQ